MHVAITARQQQARTDPVDSLGGCCECNNNNNSNEEDDDGENNNNKSSTTSGSDSGISGGDKDSTLCAR